MAHRTIDQLGIADVARVLRSHRPSGIPFTGDGLRAAVAVVLRAREAGGLEMLFIKRAEHADDPWSGDTAFPGGRMEACDATLEAVARRETLEEVGLELARDEKLGRLDDVNPVRPILRALHVTPFVYRCDGVVEFTPNKEVSEILWVPLGFLGDCGNVRPHYPDVGDLKGPFPALQYDGYTIWGITYRVLVDFMNLFGMRLPVNAVLL